MGPAVDRQPERAADVGGRAVEVLVAAEVAVEHGGGGPSSSLVDGQRAADESRLCGVGNGEKLDAPHTGP